MRLGKKKEKDKDTDTGKSQTLEGVNRLICSSKSSHNTPLRGNEYNIIIFQTKSYCRLYLLILFFLVYIDGTEWSSVKFFQLSMQWQTHIKTFPIALLGAPLAPQELT